MQGALAWLLPMQPHSAWPAARAAHLILRARQARVPQHAARRAHRLLAMGAAGRAEQASAAPVSAPSSNCALPGQCTTGPPVHLPVTSEGKMSDRDPAACAASPLTAVAASRRCCVAPLLSGAAGGHRSHTCSGRGAPVHGGVLDFLVRDEQHGALLVGAEQLGGAVDGRLRLHLQAERCARCALGLATTAGHAERQGCCCCPASICPRSEAHAVY